MNEPERAWLQARRERDLADRPGRSPVAVGGRSLYRPGELLLEAWAEEHLLGLLTRRYGGRRYGTDDPDHWRNAVGLPAESGDLNARLSEADSALWTLPSQPATEDLPALVAELRDRLSTVDGPATPGVSLNQVYCAEPIYQGGPGGEPYPVGPLTLRTGTATATGTGTGTGTGRPDLAILDTGLPDGWPNLHPPLAGSLVPDANNVNRLYQEDAASLATQAGHGLFICGLVHRVAPDLVVDPGRVLDPTGVGDDATVAAELLATEAPVICLSLGCYTDDDAPPPGLSAALARKGRDVAIVAAAGNNASGRPFWPAASKHVIAVAGYDANGTEPARTCFSNFGPWVDVCAPAVDLRSTYVDGVWAAHDGNRTFHGWAAWSGTSFAAPLVAAEIARRLAGSDRTARQVAYQLLAELADAPWSDLGALYRPPVDLSR